MTHFHVVSTFYACCSCLECSSRADMSFTILLSSAEFTQRVKVKVNVIKVVGGKFIKRISSRRQVICNNTFFSG